MLMATNHSNSSFKETLQKLLGRIGLHQRAKASWLYDLYWSVADRRIIEDRKSEVDFYRNLLNGFRPGDLIFDVGANLGYKSDIFLRLGAKIVAMEPDEKCQKILQEKFLSYRIRRKPLLIVDKAVSDKSSIQTMWVEAAGSAMNTLSEKWAEALRSDETRFGQKLNFGEWKQVETVSIEQLIATYGSPFFIKIDVEGHELSVLRGMQRPVPYVSFEVNLPEFRLEGLECVQVLEGLDADGGFNYTSDCKRGVLLKDWVGADEFSHVLRSCTDKSIEVLWKASVSKNHMNEQ
jgi:FkbM family methyltransferase